MSAELTSRQRHRRNRWERQLLNGSLNVRSPFPAPSLYMVYDWARFAWKHVADDTTPKTREEFIHTYNDMVTAPGIKTWGVWRGEELGGLVLAARQMERPWLARVHCIFKQTFFATPTTTIVCRQIFQELFNDGVLKIEMWVFEDNNSIRGMIRYLGAREEGMLTAQVMRDGEPVNIVVYGLSQESLRQE